MIVAPYARESRAAAASRMQAAAHRPEHLEELLRWFRSEWAKEVPTRLHERGTEPESALGSPRLAGAFRAYLMSSPLATDHDDRLDIDHRGAVRRYPIHAALRLMEHRWPLSARYLFALAWTGEEWQDVALAWKLLPEIGHRFAHDALAHLWDIWARDEINRPGDIPT